MGGLAATKLIVFVVLFLFFVVGLFFATSTTSTAFANDGIPVDRSVEPISHDTNSSFSGSSCAAAVEKVKQLVHPWEFNELRRAVAMENPTCFENELFPIFARAFQSRIGVKQYNLHIPKTGGTSLCDLAKDNGLKSKGNNCHPNSLGAYWCCMGKAAMKPLSCEQLQASPSDFVANERWLDHDGSLFCSDMAYSISLREPVGRAMSQMNMYLQNFVSSEKTNRNAALRAKRIGIIQSNYMTWSLVSGTSEDPTMFSVKAQHLALAKQILSRFDYVMDIGGSTPPACLATILAYMGMSNNTLSHKRKSGMKNYPSLYHEDQYEMLNAVDTKLYQYAQEVIRIDCEFFERIKEFKDAGA